MLTVSPYVRDLVLVGGGHAHALALRALAMNPVAGLRITLVSPDPLTPYSGMLPGLLAGHYGLEETHIDLPRLCQWAGVRFFADAVEGLDPARREVYCRGRGAVAYDILSLDIGSQPELDSVPGAREFATPVKPVAGLWKRWQALRKRDLRGQRLAVVGGGAGSLEVALAMAHRLRDQEPLITLYCGSSELLEGYGTGARRAAEQACERLGVALTCGRRVTEVRDGAMIFEDGSTADFDELIWSTGAAAAPWVAASGLETDERGFLRIEDTLQSTNYAEVFGAGDIATQHRHPRPKAGVYAVRQGPVLAANLAAFACGEALRTHRPQKRFLSLLSLGEQRAVAERHGLSVGGAWTWRWKDRIDRDFMQRFTDLKMRRPDTLLSTRKGLRDVPEADLPERADDRVAALRNEQAPCGGCGAKVGADILHGVLDALRSVYPEHIATAAEADDAATLGAPQAFVQSIDALRALVDDPWRMGRIAAQHALSDLYASGARPASAQALVTLPFATADLLRRDLYGVLGGALSVFSTVGCRLIGGHSMQGPEMQIAFAVNGVVEGEDSLSARGARPGDRLLLSRPLGSGALFAAHMQGRADGRDVEAALAGMEAGNARAAAVAREFRASALTDLTGFGLAGHLAAMLDAGVEAEIDLDALPLLAGADAALKAGTRSTMHAANRASVRAWVSVPDVAANVEARLYDPQTSGGLLMALAPEVAQQALETLNRDLHPGEPPAALIGQFGEAGAMAPARGASARIAAP